MNIFKKRRYLLAFIILMPVVIRNMGTLYRYSLISVSEKYPLYKYAKRSSLMIYGSLHAYFCRVCC